MSICPVYRAIISSSTPAMAFPSTTKLTKAWVHNPQSPTTRVLSRNGQWWSWEKYYRKILLSYLIWLGRVLRCYKCNKFGRVPAVKTSEYKKSTAPPGALICSTFLVRKVKRSSDLIEWTTKFPGSARMSPWAGSLNKTIWMVKKADRKIVWPGMFGFLFD